VTPEEADAARLDLVRSIILERCDWRFVGLRVLDLASRIGVFSEALAADGATVVAIEGRQANLDQVPVPARATYVKSDVRMVDFTSQFDVTLCLGLLYHLEAHDALALLRALAGCTKRFMIIDTHLADATLATEWVEISGSTYRGSVYGEGDARAPWSAMHNLTSFWFTDASLRDLLHEAGWGEIETIEGPVYPGEPEDRRWYVVHNLGAETDS
jgi:hypothetical protein